VNEQITEIIADGHRFQLDLGRKVLFTEKGEPVHLTSDKFRLLAYLIKQPAYLVLGKRDLRGNVWGNAEISDAGLHQAIKSLQRALSKRGGHFLKIVPGQGYRIEAEIRGRSKQATRSISGSPEEAMVFLLFVDQFPNGIWGASLENAAELWGHKNDPGSITISTRASIGLTSATGSTSLPPIAAYRKYLLSRCNRASGAFGMLRDAGSSWMPDRRIQEHARHTATALRFFQHYDGVEHPCVTGAVRYLLNPNSRTTSGYWADKGERSDTAADPVTVAFVVGALEEVHRSLSNTGNCEEAALPDITAVNDAIVVGLNYIHSTSLRTAEGMWHYKFSDDLSYQRVLDNLYQYTADVLAQTSPSCVRLDMYIEETRQIALRLKRICKQYNGGLPQSPSQNTVHLDTTATLIEALWHLQESVDHLETHILDAYELARRRDVIELSTASGWSAFLLLSRFPFGEKLRMPSVRAEELLRTANEVILGGGAAGSIPSLSEASEEFICGLLRRREGRQPA
jgi:DNA-binding winged helix-turn-helix (wHTH) protein